jgi:hypothetical protein
MNHGEEGISSGHVRCSKFQCEDAMHWRENHGYGKAEIPRRREWNFQCLEDLLAPPLLVSND